MTRMLTKKMRGSYECSGTLGKMQLKDWFDLVLNEKKKGKDF